MDQVKATIAERHASQPAQAWPGHGKGGEGRDSRARTRRRREIGMHQGRRR